MKTQGGTVENLGLHASKALIRLGEWLAGDGIIDLVGSLGLSLPDSPAAADLKSAAADLSAAAGALRTPTEALIAALEAEPIDNGAVAGAAVDLFAAIEQVVAAIQPVRLAIESFDGLPPGVLSDFATLLLKRLVDFVAITHIELEWPFLSRVLVALGIVELERLEADPATFRSRHVRRSLNLERLKLLLDPTKNPAETLYRWGHDDLRGDELLEIVSQIGLSVGIPVFYSKPEGEEGRIDLGPVQLIHRPDLSPSGFAAQLSDLGFNPEPFPISFGPTLQAELRLETAASQPPAILIEPGQAPRLQNPGSLQEGRLGFAVQASSDSTGKLLLLGQPDGSRLEADSLNWSAELRVEPSGEGVFLTPRLSAGVTGGSLAISLEGGDGFLNSLLAEGPQLDFDFGLGWDLERGLYLSQGAGLSIVIPIQKALGPLLIDALHLEASAAETGPRLEFSATLSGALGPVKFSLDRVGTQVDFLTGDESGPLRVEFGFKPPRGIGLAFDSGVFTGGGFLQFDASKEEYSGALQLEAAGVQLSAIGLLTTRLPDGQDGFSLLVLLAAEFSPGFQLGYGFSLTKVGGLLGIHRSVQLETLREGLHAGTLGSVLFPPDPVRNAPQILRDLAAVFPPDARRHVFGPVVEIAWGLPRPLVKMQLAVVLELPPPIRVVLLGRIQMFLPDEAVPLARINLDSVGTLDPQQGQISIDATLFDSTLTLYALTGEMAMRVRYGGNPQFALALGGFHPAFQPPPGFPALERVAISMSSGNNPRLRLEAYLALTSNTLQVGARLELYAAAAGFSISGTLGFDGLFQFSPFQFIAEISGRVALKQGSHNLMSLTLKLTLSGIAPWRARGSVSFKILFFKGSIHFDKTFGGGSQPAVPTLQVWPLLKEALESPGSWSAELPAGATRLVALANPEGEPGPALLHPLATPTVRQKIVPLGIPLDRVGQARPGDGDRFALASQAFLGAGGERRSVAADSVADYFAAAQFQDLSDADKLSRPSFEPMQAGVTLGGGSIAAGTATARTVEYEEILIDARRRRAVPLGRLQSTIGLAKGEFQAGAAAAAASRADLRPDGLRFGAESIRVDFKDAEYVLADLDGLASSGVEPEFQASHAAIGSRGSGSGRQVVERSELDFGANLF